MKSIVIALIFSFGAFASFSNAGSLRRTDIKETVLFGGEDTTKLEQKKTSVCVQNIAEDGNVDGNLVIADNSNFNNVESDIDFTLIPGKGSCLTSTHMLHAYVYGRSNEYTWQGQACRDENELCYIEIYLGSGNSAVTYCFKKGGNSTTVRNGEPCDEFIEVK
mmetsp:Transcript_7863/g.9649  ORF Transcript_7863/g.9649 Transcript_7863/m.9649 type:complete len:163 (-) Transcript_7863:169-657(-)